MPHLKVTFNVEIYQWLIMFHQTLIKYLCKIKSIPEGLQSGFISVCKDWRDKILLLYKVFQNLVVYTIKVWKYATDKIIMDSGDEGEIKFLITGQK